MDWRWLAPCGNDFAYGLGISSQRIVEVAMLFLLGGQDKKNRKPETQKIENHDRVKDLFLNGKFPVVTTDLMEGKMISKVLGLVCCRGYDSEEAFFGMAARAVNKGAHAIVGYSENVAFHPDGSKYFSCFGTAVMFEWEAEERFGAAALRDTPLQLVRTGGESSSGRQPYAQRSDASGERDDRSAHLAPRMDASAPERERAPRAPQRGSDSGGERSGRLNTRFADDLDELPPLRPVGASPSWHRTSP
jgi:uncharacterized protein YbjQ (UPF0145 family)